MPTDRSAATASRPRLPFMCAQWYARTPARCGALYLGRWSLHWELDGPVKVSDGQVVTVYARPRRRITLWRWIDKSWTLPLWLCRAYCEHGFGREAWWHRCDYVTAENPTGRPSERELFPDDYDEDGVHWADKTCFCDLKPEFSLCSMHPEEDE